MRVIFTIFLLVTLVSSLGWGQTGDVNSSTQASNAQVRARIDQLNTFSWRIRDTAFAQAKVLANDALNLSQQISYSRGEIASAYILANFEKKDRNMRAAVRFAETGMAAAKRINDRSAELQGLSLMVDIYRQFNRKNKLAEAQLAYDNLAKSIQLDQASSELNTLQQEYEGTENALQRLETTNDLIEQELNLTREEKLEREAEVARLDREKTMLENNLLQLENESIKQELELSQQRNDLLEVNDQLRRQRFWQILLAAGLVASALIIFLMLRNYRLKRAQAEEKASMQRQMMVQEKMATLGQMTAGIAHEIKNPLNFVNNFAEGSRELATELEESLVEQKERLSNDNYGLMEEIVGDLKQNAADILQHGQRADRIVSSMMAHARGDKGQREVLDINKLLLDNLHLAYHGFRSTHASFNLTIEDDLQADLPSLKAVPQDLGRAFLNIFNNACYALQQQGTTNEKPTLSVSTERDGEWVKIGIRDNGPGIPKAVQEEIFHPFFTTKPTGEGNTGLGLSITYDAIVQLHNGTVEVDSQEGQFTEFTIRLPLEQ